MERHVTPPPKEVTAPEICHYRLGDLALNRTAVLNLGEIPQVSLEYFKSTALPPLRGQIDIARIKTSLEGAQLWSRGSGWTAFKKESGVSEEEAFEALSKVFDAVVREGGKVANTPATLRFASRATQSPLFDRSNATRPDAYLLLVDKKGVHAREAQKNNAKNSDPDPWYDIAVSFEFKKDDGAAERRDDDKKVVWSLHYIMRSNPCRRATFGVTIENTEMRFWFTCRAVTLVSKSFNFLAEPEHLIHFFCALAFASDHELGWDPTIRIVCVEGKTQYIITVQRDGGKTSEYQTTRVISDFDADGVRGRGTCALEVHRKSPDGKLDAEPVVLKDSWRDCDRDREDKILEEIFGDLQRLRGVEEETEARKYFPTATEAGDVAVDGKIDGTVNLLCASDLPADCTSYQLSVDGIPKPKPTRSGEGLAPSFLCVPGPTKHSKVYHRIHFRVVFKEVCKPIYELQDLGTAFKTLQGVHKALRFLHSVNWVHRDVSAGNVLRAVECGKLADLEYAKRTDSNTTHEVRTGTLDFMACEVEAQNYLFEPLMTRPFGGVPNPPFRFNPLHDMESLWWIQTWMLCYHVDKAHSEPSSEQRTWFRILFPRQLKARFYEFSIRLNYYVLPATFHLTAHAVEGMHQELRRAYLDSEKDLPQPPAYTAPLQRLHSAFTEGLATAVEHAQGVTLFIPTVKRPN